MNWTIAVMLEVVPLALRRSNVTKRTASGCPATDRASLFVTSRFDLELNFYELHLYRSAASHVWIL